MNSNPEVEKMASQPSPRKVLPVDFSAANSGFKMTLATPAPPRRRAEGIHPSYVDVMCCLVILFLLTSLLATSGVMQDAERTLPPVKLPQLSVPSAAGEPNPSAVGSLTVLPGPEFLLNTEALTKAALIARLQADRPAELEIRADATVPYGQVMAAFEICQQVGIAQVSLTYQPQQPKL